MEKKEKKKQSWKKNLILETKTKKKEGKIGKKMKKCKKKERKKHRGLLL
jgi:hypothetical protein